MERFIPIGYTHKIHGLKGELKASFEAFFLDHLDRIDFIFLKINNVPVPFHLDGIKPLPNGLFIIKLEKIDDAAVASQYENCEVMGDTERWPQLLETNDEEEEEYLNFLLDYQAQINGEVIGHIEDIMYSNAQDLAVVIVEGEEIYIPLLDETIHEINRQEKYINFDLPENYLKVFLPENPAS